jgi:DNA-binding transcriptional ArsR family regulator
VPRNAASAQRLDLTLAALADPTRRGVVELLRRRPHRAGELAAAFRASPPALSRHLRILRSRGLVEETRVEDDARVRVYSLRREPFDALQAWLRELEACWSDQLESFASHVARREAARPSAGREAARRPEPTRSPRRRAP